MQNLIPTLEISKSAVVSPFNDNQLAVQALGEMPESNSLQQIIEELAILAAIREGEKAADDGRVLSHEDVKKRSAEWTGK